MADSGDDALARWEVEVDRRSAVMARDLGRWGHVVMPDEVTDPPQPWIPAEVWEDAVGDEPIDAEGWDAKEPPPSAGAEAGAGAEDGDSDVSRDGSEPG